VDTRSKLKKHYLHTCKLDILSLKPGNVSVYSGVKDLTESDFLRSADASAEPITNPAATLGERIFTATQATQSAVGTNTKFAQHDGEAIRPALENVLLKTSVDDARYTYRAIRLANPGGMGEKDNQDISEEPNVSLLNTMEIAKEWDQIAVQYSNNFDEIFNFGVPRYEKLIEKWNDEKWATTGVFMSFLAHYPDSLIERKYGLLKAREISDMISDLEMELYRSDSPGRYEAQLLEIDRQLKRNLINPGTSADLTAASIFAAGLVQL